MHAEPNAKKKAWLANRAEQERLALAAQAEVAKRERNIELDRLTREKYITIGRITPPAFTPASSAS